MLGAIMPIAVLARFSLRPHLPRRGPLALQRSGDDAPWDLRAAFEALAEAWLGSDVVPPARHQASQHLSVLIHRAPEIMALPRNREPHCISRPWVPRLGAAMPPLVGILLSQFPAPLADRLICDNEAPCDEAFFHISLTEAAPVVQPDAGADDRDRATVVCRAVGGEGVHPASLSYRNRSRQVDNAL
jgi:hypothetical protein